MERLEAIVGDLEEGNLGLAGSLDRYEEGVKLLKQCYGLLGRAERRIELLAGVDAEGNPVTEPFDDETTTSLEEKAENRARRRSHGASKRASSQREPRGGKPSRDVDEEPGLF